MEWPSGNLIHFTSISQANNFLWQHIVPVVSQLEAKLSTLRRAESKNLPSGHDGKSAVGAHHDLRDNPVTYELIRDLRVLDHLQLAVPKSAILARAPNIDERVNCDAGGAGISSLYVLDDLVLDFHDLPRSILSNGLAVPETVVLAIAPGVDLALVVEGNGVTLSATDVFHVLARQSIV